MKISQAAKIWIDYHVTNSKKIPPVPTGGSLTNFELISEKKSILFASAGFGGGCSAGVYHNRYMKLSLPSSDLGYHKF